MLQLMNITKNYKAGSTTVEALKGVSLEFRENEFVCVLGPSGCGKTTLLNIIGGLDQYTTGDLVINGKSTKDYRDADWDAYRNHSIGFVFQTYNLIPHQSVLSNVELALTLTGVSKSERTARAKAVIESVGLADQTYKKPNQLSGGQMQRVAIARALVNNPDILLADEPTGSLDSETSVQIMEILKEISKDTLVIMVTHNPELADRYSTRIVRLLDGLVTQDSAPEAPPEPEKTPEAEAKKRAAGKRPSMSFFTALALSLNNLMTKKTRTALTAFAGSIGIIGIALILSLSNGLQSYISRVEEETLSSYPIMIEKETFDLGALVESRDESRRSGEWRQGATPEPRPLDKIYISSIMARITNTAMSSVKTNDLATFRRKLMSDSATLDPLVTSISYGYSVPLDLFKEDGLGGAFQVNPNPVLEAFNVGRGGGQFSSPMMTGGSNFWQKLIDNRAFLMTQYDLIAGRWPSGANDAVLMVSEENRVSDVLLYSLGLRGPSDLRDFQQAIISGEHIDIDRNLSYTYDEVLALSYRLVLPVDRYVKTDDGWVDMSDDFVHMQNVYGSSEIINIVGIIRPGANAVATSPGATIGYTSDLTKFIIEKTNEAEIVRAQLQSPDADILTGKPFSSAAAFASIDDVYAYIKTLSGEAQEQAIAAVTSMRESGASDDSIVAVFNQSTSSQVSSTTYEKNMRAFGFAEIDKPTSVNIYPSSFENKEAIIAYIDEYNDSVEEEYKITYTDYVGLLMSSVTTVINAISYVLIAFVSISLVVSSIMIGIITYISVLERTKEIGILRSIGASKRDISRVFNAETLIIGFVAGALGIIVTLLLCIPANAIILKLTEINNVAKLPAVGGAILVGISMALSVIAGLIPSRVAARKDPVVALRTE